MSAKPSFANPMRTDGFEFVEYAAPDPELLRRLFESMGLPAVARHRSKNVTLHNQGDINFIINAEHDSFAQKFARAHGPCACAMAFRVADARVAFSRALELGAKPGPARRPVALRAQRRRRGVHGWLGVERRKSDARMGGISLSS